MRTEDDLAALERIAAMLEGSLEPEERQKLLEAIEADEDLYRIFVGTIEYLTSGE